MYVLLPQLNHCLSCAVVLLHLLSMGLGNVAVAVQAVNMVLCAVCCVLQRCATAGDSCNDILMLDGKMPAIVVSPCVRN